MSRQDRSLVQKIAKEFVEKEKLRAIRLKKKTSMGHDHFVLRANEVIELGGDCFHPTYERSEELRSAIERKVNGFLPATLGRIISTAKLQEAFRERRVGEWLDNRVVTDHVSDGHGKDVLRKLAVIVLLGAVWDHLLASIEESSMTGQEMNQLLKKSGWQTKRPPSL